MDRDKDELIFGIILFSIIITSIVGPFVLPNI